MQMLAVVHMRAAGRFRIKFQSGIIQLFQPHARSIKTHQGVFPYEIEENAPILLTLAKLLLVRQAPQNLVLLGGFQRRKSLPMQPFRVCIEPTQTKPKPYCTLGSLQTMKSTNSLTPASRAPAPPSLGMIISVSRSTVVYSAGVKNCGA